MVSIYSNSLQHTLLLLFFFFFQAEDGIRDYKVTGVQTCALPIYIKDNSVLKMIEHSLYEGALYKYRNPADGSGDVDSMLEHLIAFWNLVRDIFRSEERRVGKECRSRWSPYH